MRRIALVALGVVTSSRVALAHPPPEPEPVEDHRPLIEWSSWIRLGYGLASEAAAPAGGVAARTTMPPPASRSPGGAWDAAFGLDFTFPIAGDGDVRMGPWSELGTHGPTIGGELAIGAVPRKLDMFFYDGQGILIARAGGGPHVVTAALAYGYRAPWRLWGPWPGATRYMIGVRVVASATRALDDPHDWSVSAGIAFEPIGSIRYLLGIRSWYD